MTAPLGTPAVGGLTSREEAVKYMPFLVKTHPDTKFQVFREFRPKKGTIEYTVFYRQPDRSKFRIDLEVDVLELKDQEPKPEDFKIVSWRPAVNAINGEPGTPEPLI